jgi:lysophospholipase L1-like esterase
MRRVLCYGDSNTWGYIPGSGGRYVFSSRWTGILQVKLGDEVQIIEDGLNGRTTATDDPGHSGRNGVAVLGPVLKRYAPLDLVVIMLGTNDMKRDFQLSAEAISRGAGMLVKIVKEYHSMTPVPEILLISPPRIRFLPFTSRTIFEEAESKSSTLPLGYERVATECDCHFFNATEIVAASLIDGVHLGKRAHLKLGEALAEKVKEILSLTDST